MPTYFIKEKIMKQNTTARCKQQSTLIAQESQKKKNNEKHIKAAQAKYKSTNRSPKIEGFGSCVESHKNIIRGSVPH